MGYVRLGQVMFVVKKNIAALLTTHVSPFTVGKDALLLLLTEVGSARLRESDIHPISPKTPAPEYQPIDRKKRKGKYQKTIEGI